MVNLIIQSGFEGLKTSELLLFVFEFSESNTIKKSGFEN